MNFAIVQHFEVEPGAVAWAYCRPDLYETFGELAYIGQPEILHHEADGDRHQLEVRYRYVGSLPAGASTFISTDDIAAVEKVSADLSTRTTSFKLHTALGRQFRGGGTTTVRPGADGHGSIRTTEGDLSIGIPLVGRKVERAIISGLEESLHAQVPLVTDWLAGQDPHDRT